MFVTNDSTHPVPTKEQNLDASGNIKVHEQGIANVNVTNASIPVNGMVSVTPGNSYLLTSGKRTANGTITVNTTKYTYVSVHICPSVPIFPLMSDLDECLHSRLSADA